MHGWYRRIYIFFVFVCKDRYIDGRHPISGVISASAARLRIVQPMDLSVPDVDEMVLLMRQFSGFFGRGLTI